MNEEFKKWIVAQVAEVVKNEADYRAWLMWSISNSWPAFVDVVTANLPRWKAEYSLRIGTKVNCGLDRGEEIAQAIRWHFAEALAIA